MEESGKGKTIKSANEGGSDRSDGDGRGGEAQEDCAVPKLLPRFGKWDEMMNLVLLMKTHLWNLVRGFINDWGNLVLRMT